MARNTFKNLQFFRNAQGEVYKSYNGQPWQPEDVAVSRKDGEAAQKEQAKQHLRNLLKPGQTIYTILRRRSASGMSHSISLVIPTKDGIQSLDYWIAQAQGESTDQKNGGIKVSGCGMDMGFHLVYNLGCMLWPNGTKKPHGARNGQPDKDGGYALKHQWL